MICFKIVNMVYVCHITTFVVFLCYIVTLFKCCRITMLVEGFGGIVWELCFMMLDNGAYGWFCVILLCLWIFLEVCHNYVLYHYDVIWGFCCMTIKNHGWLWHIMFDDGQPWYTILDYDWMWMIMVDYDLLRFQHYWFHLSHYDIH